MAFITTYQPGTSPVHELHARAKLIGLIALSLILVALPLEFAWSWIVIIFITGIVVVGMKLSDVSLASYIKVGVPLYFILALTLVSNSLMFLNSGGFIFSFWGVVRGLFFCIRVCVLFWASLVVCFTTTSEMLLDSFVWLLGPLSKFGVPVNAIALTFSLALRFIPQLVRDYEQVRSAQWARGAQFSSGSFFQRLSTHVLIINPVFVLMISRAQRLSQAMDARCFGYSERGKHK